MANVKISALTSATSMANTEVFPIVQGGVTKKITKSAARGYLVYNGIVNQDASSDPVVTVLLPNDVGPIVWTYDQTGQYTGTLSGVFLVGKVVVFLNLGDNVGFTTWRRDTNDTLIIRSFDETGAANDGKFSNGSIEIRVYP